MGLEVLDRVGGTLLVSHCRLDGPCGGTPGN